MTRTHTGIRAVPIVLIAVFTAFGFMPRQAHAGWCENLATFFYNMCVDACVSGQPSGVAGPPSCLQGCYNEYQDWLDWCGGSASLEGIREGEEGSEIRLASIKDLEVPQCGAVQQSYIEWDIVLPSADSGG